MAYTLITGLRSAGARGHAARLALALRRQRALRERRHERRHRLLLYTWNIHGSLTCGAEEELPLVVKRHAVSEP